MKKCLLPLILISSFALAESPRDHWYKSEGGETLIAELTKGTLFASLSKSKADKWRIYFQYSDNDCKDKSSDATSHDPVQVNGKLVKFGQYCLNGSRFFYATSDAGAEYLFNQFLKKQPVELITTGDTPMKFIFNTKDFESRWDILRKEDSAL